jgi:membrane protein YdbS with pleckstrin-like domain
MEILLAVVLGLIVNEMSDVSPWAARKMVRWSAQVRYGDAPRAADRAEELAALIDERPGKLFKLGTATRFVSAALATRVRRLVSGDAEEVELTGREVTWDEASALVSRYLFPTEQFRGEWRRHWIYLIKAIGTSLGIGTLAVWATLLRIKPHYAGWIVAGIIGYTVFWVGYRLVSWYVHRFVITNKRLVLMEGVFNRRVRMLPLARVTDMNYDQSPMGRILNYGTFHLESVNRWSTLRRIRDLPNPNELYLRLVEEMYEPEAVLARLNEDPADSLEVREFLELPDFGELVLPDDVEDVAPSDSHQVSRPATPDVQRLIGREVSQLAAQLAALTAAIERLGALSNESADRDAELESGLTRPVTPDPAR